MGRGQTRSASEIRIQRDEFDLELYPLFLAFNRRLLSIFRALSSPVSPRIGHILAAVADKPGITAKEIGGITGIEKSSVSRALRWIIGRELVSERANDADHRSKELFLTAAGGVVLSIDSRILNREFDIAVAPLDEPKIEELRVFLAGIADSLETPAVNPRPDDHPIKREVRRLTRGMGFIGNSCMSTGLPVEECQVLQLARERNGVIPMTTLCQTVPYDTSATSRLISDLAERGLVSKRRSTTDQRLIDVSLTAAGASLAATAAQRGELFIRRALASSASEQVARLADILRAFVFAPLPTGAAAEPLPVRRLKTKGDMRRGRAYLVEQLVVAGRHHHLSERLLGRNSIIGCIIVDDQPRGLIETRENGVTEHLVWDEGHPEQERHIVLSLIEWALTTTEATKLELTPALTENPALVRLFPSIASPARPHMTLQDLKRLRG